MMFPRRPRAVLEVGLPPGQRLIDGFPRFGGHLSRPAPAAPTDPVIEICGAVLVSPKQYGYVSTKHLCRIEVHTAEPG